MVMNSLMLASVLEIMPMSAIAGGKLLIKGAEEVLARCGF